MLTNEETIARIEKLCLEYRTEGTSAEIILRVIQLACKNEKSNELFERHKHIPLRVKNGKPDFRNFLNEIYNTYPEDVKIVKVPAKLSKDWRSWIPPKYYSWDSAQVMFRDPVGCRLDALHKWLKANFKFMYKAEPVNDVYVLR